MQSVEAAAQPEMAAVEQVEMEAVPAAPTEEPRAAIATEEAAAEPTGEGEAATAAAATESGALAETPAEGAAPAAAPAPEEEAMEEAKTAEGSAAPQEDQVPGVEVAAEAAEAVEEAKTGEGSAAPQEDQAPAAEMAAKAVEATEVGDRKATDGADVEMKDASVQQQEADAAECRAPMDEAPAASTTEVAIAETSADTCSQSNKFDSVQADADADAGMEVDANANADGAKAPTPTTDAPATSGDEAAAAEGEAGEKRGQDADVDSRPTACDGAVEATAVAAISEEMQPAADQEPAKSPEAGAADGAAAMDVDAGEQQLPAEDVKPAGLESTPVKGLPAMETDTPQKALQIISEPQTKRPLTPIFQFIHDTRAKIQQDFNVKKITDVAKIAKGLFDALSDEERKFYEDQYEEKKRAFEAFMATEQGEEHAKEQARKGGSSRSSRRAAPKPTMKKAKAPPKAAATSKKSSKVLRPVGPVVQYTRDNRYRIMAEHGVKRAIDLPKKAKELFDQLPEEERKAYQDRYEQQKVAWTQFKASEKTAIKQYKTQLSKQREQEESKKRAQLGSAFRAGAKPPPARAAAKRSRKAPTSSAPSRSAKQPKVAEVPVVLSPAGMERAKKMGMAPSGVPYIRLVEKLLATPHMEKIAEDEALDSLKKFKGNVNLARNEIKSKVIEL